MFLLLPSLSTDPSYWKIFNIHHKKNDNYVEFDFKIGTVLMIFSFFWTDNATCLPPSLE